MGLMDYVAAIRRHWLVIIVITLVGAAAGFGLGKTTAPTYRATSEVFVSVAGGESVSELVQGSTFTQNAVQSFAQLATMSIVLDPVIGRLNLDTTPRHLAQRVQVDSPVNTVIISISVDAVEPREAAAIANAIADQLPRTVDTLMPSKRESGIRLTTVAEAAVPSYPISPNTKLYIAIGIVAGGMVGVAFAVIRRLLNTRIGGRDDLAETTGLAVLGVIPAWKSKANDYIPLLEEPDSVTSESYRRLRSNLDFLWTDAASSKSVVLTSAKPADGKSTTSMNLALSLAERGDRVVLVDADLRRPSLAKATGLEQAVGLTTVLIDRVPLRQALQTWGETSLDVLTSGEIPPNALQLIDSPKMRTLLGRLKDLYDYVIIDAPPLLSVVDASLLARETDGVIVVAASGHTKRAQVVSVIEALDQAGKRPVGAVLTRAREKASGYGYASQEPS